MNYETAPGLGKHSAEEKPEDENDRSEHEQPPQDFESAIEYLEKTEGLKDSQELTEDIALAKSGDIQAIDKIILLVNDEIGKLEQDETETETAVKESLQAAIGQLEAQKTALRQSASAELSNYNGGNEVVVKTEKIEKIEVEPGSEAEAEAPAEIETKTVNRTDTAGELMNAAADRQKFNTAKFDAAAKFGMAVNPDRLFSASYDRLDKGQRAALLGVLQQVSENWTPANSGELYKRADRAIGRIISQRPDRGRNGRIVGRRSRAAGKAAA